jgi:hypothetical protein
MACITSQSDILKLPTAIEKNRLKETDPRVKPTKILEVPENGYGKILTSSYVLCCFKEEGVLK